MSSAHRLMLCSCPSRESALELARALVSERLAACVSMTSGVTSVYRWKGQVLQEEEVLLVVKTATHRVERLTARLRELHPYEVPEIIAVPITEGLEDYLRWIDECTTEATA